MAASRSRCRGAGRWCCPRGPVAAASRARAASCLQTSDVGPRARVPHQGAAPGLGRHDHQPHFEAAVQLDADLRRSLRSRTWTRLGRVAMASMTRSASSAVVAADEHVEAADGVLHAAHAADDGQAPVVGIGRRSHRESGSERCPRVRDQTARRTLLQLVETVHERVNGPGPKPGTSRRRPERAASSRSGSVEMPSSW